MDTRNVFERTHGFRHVAPPAEQVRLLPTWRAVVLDAAAWRAVDPRQPGTCVLWALGTEPLEVKVGDVVAVRFEPTDEAPEGDSQLTIAAYELIVAHHGHDDAGEVSPDYERQGAKAMLAALPPDAMRAAPLRVWRGEPEARVRMVEAVGRSFGMSPSAIEAVTGRSFVARRTLLPPMGRARELDAQRQAGETMAQQATAAAQAVEAAKPRTAGPLGVDGVVVRRDRLGVIAQEPFSGARLLWATDEVQVYGWQRIPGMCAPVFDRDGVRSLRPDELVPLDAQPALEADWPVIHWVRARRAEVPSLDFGPTSDFSAEVNNTARQLAAKYARGVLVPTVTRAWITDYVIEALVRAAETRLRPDVAAECLLAAMDAEFARQFPSFVTPGPMAGAARALAGDFTDLVPPAVASLGTVTHERYGAADLPSVRSRAFVSARAVQAALSGEYVAAGESLDAPADSASVSQHAEAASARGKTKSSSK